MKYKVCIEDNFGPYYVCIYVNQKGGLSWTASCLSATTQECDRFTLSTARYIINHRSIPKYNYKYKIEPIL